jgi:hypothetical protein
MLQTGRPAPNRMVDYCLLLTRLTLRGLVEVWPITLAVTAPLILSLWANSPLSHRDFRSVYVLIMVPAGLTAVAIVSGLIWVPLAGILLLNLQLLLVTFLAKRFWQYQFFVVAAGFFQIWVSAVTVFYASGVGIAWSVLGGLREP